ncbi:MAG: polysaccharide deacetylase family protein [Propionibacteriaceae bacterium]|nr:polysaccharide deacetylase family protein [Propionibacteriaceae bacterium]
MPPTRRDRWAIALVAALVTGCTAAPVRPPSSAPLPSSGTNHPVPPAELALVDPSLVTGLTSVVSEDLKRGQFTYLAYPSIPGGKRWTKAISTQLAPKVQRFRELAPKDVTAPYPELSVVWDLVAASPDAVGVRLATTELGEDDTFEGDVETSWWDPAAKLASGPSALIAEDASPEFFDRLTTAAEADSRVDMQSFREQLDGEWEGIRSVAFTTGGDLWVEFSRRQVSDADSPLGVSVDPAGILSDFGTAARQAALTPSDPSGKESAAPTPSPSPSTASASPSATRSTTPASTSPTPSAKSPNCAKLKCVALTFDDGPVTGTAHLLNTLKRKGVHATFFTVGYNAAAHPELLRRMLAEGHVIGNHTYSHQQLTRLSAGGVRSEITKANALIEKATGSTPTLIRPPYGATDPAVKQVVASLGMSQILWNVDPLDWKDRNSALVTQRVLAAARPGSIILSHDIHPTTRAAYGRIIDGLRAKGFTLVTVPELLGSKLKPGASFRGR